MNALPDTIKIANARLPQTYEQAKNALAQCASIDECQDWANKAEALASYAKMADDDSLRVLADRIQARAVRRAGELLKQFDGRGGDRSRNGGDPTFAHHQPTRREMGERGGMSVDQQVTAVRVANVPDDVFDAAVDGPSPPTVTKLAEMGKQTRAPGFKQATQLIGAVSRFAEFCQQNDPELVAGGVLSAEADEIRRLVATIDGWLDRFVVNLGRTP